MTNKQKPDGVFESLRISDGEDVHITSEDMKILVDILGCVSVVLRNGKLWFNDKKQSTTYADFCERIARKFANIKIQREQ